MKRNSVQSLLAVVALLSLLILGCGKELSEENGNPGGPVDGGADGQGTSSGSLAGAGTTCDNFLVFGGYAPGLVTDTSNYVLVSLNITGAGTYIVSSDTVNGISFSGQGTTSTTGNVQARLNARGTPSQVGSFTYNVTWKGTTCSFTVDVATLVPPGTGDYFPMTAGSNWSYMSSDPAATDDDTLFTLSTGQQGSLPDGTVFNLFATDYGFGFEDSAFYRKAGNDFRELGDVDVFGVSSEILTQDFIFLKDNQPVGTKWETALVQGPNGTGGTVSTKRTFEIVGKGVSATLNQKTYQDVIKVRVQQLVASGSSFTTVITYETWFAKGIGLINLAADAPYYGYSLTRHQVF